MTKLIINDKSLSEKVELMTLEVGDWFRLESRICRRIDPNGFIDTEKDSGILAMTLETGDIFKFQKNTLVTPIKEVEVNI